MNPAANAGEIALITGANRGIGFATARRLGSAGVKVLLGARDSAKGSLAADLLRAEGLDVEALELDVASRESVVKAAAEVESAHGRLDILVNNAGILPEATASEANRPLDLEMFTSTFEVNVFGPVLVTEQFLPLLRKSAAARIVNVSSTMGSLVDQSDPSSGYYGMVLPAYQTSKAALNGLTIALSKALAEADIKVNAVCPGWVQTDLGGAENREAAPTPADEAATTVARMALLADGSPSGQFVDSAGAVPW